MSSNRDRESPSFPRADRARRRTGADIEGRLTARRISESAMPGVDIFSLAVQLRAVVNNQPRPTAKVLNRQGHKLCRWLFECLLSQRMLDDQLFSEDREPIDGFCCRWTTT